MSECTVAIMTRSFLFVALAALVLSTHAGGTPSKQGRLAPPPRPDGALAAPLTPEDLEPAQEKGRSVPGGVAAMDEGAETRAERPKSRLYPDEGEEWPVGGGEGGGEGGAHDDTEGRLFGLKNFFSLSRLLPQKMFPPKLKKRKPVVAPSTTKGSFVTRMCGALGGVEVDQQCIEFVETRLPFVEAKGKCLAKGGDLYVPLRHEVLFFSKYFLHFPYAFQEDLPSLGWVGAWREGAGAPVVTAHGDDVTRDAIYNIFTISDTKCVHISLDVGTAFLRGADCRAPLPFTCEYVFDDAQNALFPPAPPPSAHQPKNNIFDLFNFF